MIRRILGIAHVIDFEQIADADIRCAYDLHSHNSSRQGHCRTHTSSSWLQCSTQDIILDVQAYL